MMRFLRDRRCPWTKVTCADAAGGGPLEALQGLISEGYRWDQRVGEFAAMGGHVSVVQSLVKHAANPLKKDAANHSAIMHAGFRHPNDAALLAAIARAANEWEYRDR